MSAAADLNFASLGFTPGDVVVITGAASGIGRATASIAARSGLVVVGWDLDGDKLEELTSEIVSAGGQAHGVVCDQTSPSAVTAAWDATQKIGPVGLLVNNAGPPNSAPLSYADGLAQAVGAVSNVTEEWLVRFGDHASSVVFTASTAAVLGGQNWYAVAKAGLAGYARSVALRSGGRPRANSVAPGFISTPRTAPWSELGEQIGARNPMGRVGQADEVAAAICFLLSPAASYINGILLPVDGGSLLTTG